MVYLIIGENTTLIEEKISEVLDKFSDIPFISLKNNSFESWIEKIESCDMFSPVSGIISYEPKWLKQKDIVDQLKNAINTANQFNIPVIIVTKAIDKRSAVYKLMKKLVVTEFQCPEFKEWETDKIKDWIRAFCKANETTIEPNAVDLLINGYGTQMGVIKQELKKCIVAILPKTSIHSDDIKNSTGSAIGLYNSLSNSVKNGNINNIIQYINALIKLKEAPHKIFNQLLFQINQMIPIALGLKEKKSNDEIAATLGKHPYFIKKQTAEILKNPIAPKLRKIITIFASLDLDIKSGKLSANQALIKFSTILRYQI